MPRFDSPFKYIRFIRTSLQALAFAIACFTSVLLLRMPASFRWNNKTLAILGLSFIAFIALLMVGSITQKDRSKTIIWIIVFLGTCITVTVLAIKAYFDAIQKTAPHVAARTGPITRRSSFPVVTVAPREKSASKPSEQRPLPPTGFRVVGVTSEPDETIVNASVEGGSPSFSQENKTWIVPETWIRLVEGGVVTTNSPPPAGADAGSWQLTAYHLDNSNGPHRWYIAGPWTVVNGDSVVETNLPVAAVLTGRVILGTVRDITQGEQPSFFVNFDRLPGQREVLPVTNLDSPKRPHSILQTIQESGARN